MSGLRAWGLRFTGLFGKERKDRELAEELESHLQMHIEDNLQSGMKPEEARRQALIKLGGVEQTRESYRHRRGVPWLETLLQDLRFAVRMLRKSPGFTVVAILTLALGIGANTAIFSVVNSVLIQPLPYAEPSGLVMLWEKNSQFSSDHNTVSPPDFLDWRGRSDAFYDMAAIYDKRENLAGNGDPEEVIVQQVSANFFSVLGVNAIVGSGFTAENGQEGHDNVVILSYGFWEERFAGDTAIIGKTISLDGHPQTIVGVAPKSFRWFIKDGSLTGTNPQMWSPFVFSQAYHDRKNFGRFLTVVARLKPNVTLPQAQAQMNTVAAQIEREYPDANQHWGVNVVALREQISGDLRPALLILFGAVGFVLLIACANVSSLLLARAANREREMAVRSAVGASRWRIARQLLTESILLAAVGGGFGIAVAVWGTNALLATSLGNPLDLRAVSIDWRVLAFAGGCTVAAGLFFGFLPSYISVHSGVSETLKEGGRGSSAGKRGRSMQSTFVVAQMGLALVLLAGSGLLIRSFIRLVGVAPGFDPNHLLTFKVSLPSPKYNSDPERLAFFQQLLARISRLPGVRSVSMNSYPPFSGLGAGTAVHILGRPEQSLMDLPLAFVCVVGQDYFRTMGIPLRSGRVFNQQELTEERHVVVINQAFADKYMSGQDPLGQKAVIFMRSLEENQNPPSEIIGVIGDVRQMGLDTPAEPAVYWPHPELVYPVMTVLVRAERDPLALVSSVRSELQHMDRELPMAGVATMDQVMSDSLSRSRFTMLILGIFATVALLLTSVGIYGVVSYSVVQRVHEIGIRMALGAERGDVFRMVIGQGLRLALVGLAIGAATALILTRMLSSFSHLLYGVGTSDPATFVAVAALLTVVELTACYIPARRATRVDPMVALRHE